MQRELMSHELAGLLARQIRERTDAFKHPLIEATLKALADSLDGTNTGALIELDDKQACGSWMVQIHSERKPGVWVMYGASKNVREMESLYLELIEKHRQDRSVHGIRLVQVLNEHEQ